MVQILSLEYGQEALEYGQLTFKQNRNLFKQNKIETCLTTGTATTTTVVVAVVVLVAVVVNHHVRPAPPHLFSRSLDIDSGWGRWGRGGMTMVLAVAFPYFL